jgi:hypothetical protein
MADDDSGSCTTFSALPTTSLTPGSEPAVAVGSIEVPKLAARRWIPVQRCNKSIEAWFVILLIFFPTHLESPNGKLRVGSLTNPGNQIATGSW